MRQEAVGDEIIHALDCHLVHEFVLDRLDRYDSQKCELAVDKRPQRRDVSKGGAA